MKFPKKFINELGLVVLFTNYQSGVVIETGNVFVFYTEGEYRTDWLSCVNEYWKEIKQDDELETIRQQLDDLRTQIEIINKGASINSTDSWEPQKGGFCVQRNGNIISDYCDPSIRIFGSVYRTRERAEWASKQMRTFNRLLCYIAEHQPDKLFDIIVDTINSDGSSVAVYLDTLNSVKDELNRKIELGIVTL